MRREEILRRNAAWDSVTILCLALGQGGSGCPSLLEGKQWESGHPDLTTALRNPDDSTALRIVI